MTRAAQTSRSSGLISSSAPSRPVMIPAQPPQRSTQSATPTPRQGNALPTTLRSRDRTPSDEKMTYTVAAMLAVTAIPPPRAHQRSRRKDSQRRMSIDDLIQEWRDEAQSRPIVGSHKSMDVLLETTEQPGDESIMSEEDALSRPDSIGSRSTSSDSIPSLEMDARSMLSVSNPPTPEATRSGRPSVLGAKRAKPLSLPTSVELDCDHPLKQSPDSDDTLTDIYVFPTKTNLPARRKSSLKSNLTVSLQAFKTRALSSLQSLNLNSGTSPATHPAASSSTFSDATLWQHPFIFPRLSSEIRPSPFTGTPSRSDRHYFNPTPLNFEEQQSHYREALHSSSNPRHDDSALPMIMMQTYSRDRSTKSRPRNSRRSKKTSPTDNSRGGLDTSTEAGRAMAGSPPLVRHREPRENSDFLRVVVLEMNMRREGKLEPSMGGRARIWLPPRTSSVGIGLTKESSGGEEYCGSQRCRCRRHNVPKRWLGVCADDA